MSKMASKKQVEEFLAETAQDILEAAEKYGEVSGMVVVSESADGSDWSLRVALNAEREKKGD